jgi:hypothetical protein
MLQRTETRLWLDALPMGPCASAGTTQTHTDEVLQSTRRLQLPI